MEEERGLISVARGLSSFHMEDLPEEIKHRVMSLLSLKEAARTGIVATNWRQLWTCYPNLCFDGSNDGSTTTDEDDDDSTVKIDRADFIATVNSIVKQHSGTWLNKFSITYSLKSKSSDHLHRWISFATASKAKAIHINLLWAKRGAQLHRFPLEALGAQDGPFIQSLFLKYVSIKPHSDMCGFTKLRRLRLHHVRIIGDLPGLLNDCCALEDLEIIACYGVSPNLNVSRRLDKLRRLVISQTRVHLVDFHVAGLTHFEFNGDVIPIELHGCPKLEKATINLLEDTSMKQQNNRALCHALTAIPGISAVKVLNVHAYMDHQWLLASQVHTLVTKPTHMFANLRHLTCEIRITVNGNPNSQNGVLQLAHYLDFAPHLETLQLHMRHYAWDRSFWRGEVTGDEVPCCTRHLDHLKTFYMSGFRCYRAQVELLCNILKRGAALEHVTIEPKVVMAEDDSLSGYFRIPRGEIREWAHRTSESFGKTITVVEEEPPVNHLCN